MLLDIFNGFWAGVARLILRNRILWLSLIVLLTGFFISQFSKIQFSNSEVSVLPNDHPDIIRYNQFLNQFGQEDNAIVIGLELDKLSEPQVLKAWNRMNKKLQASPEITQIISLEKVQLLFRNEDNKIVSTSLEIAEDSESFPKNAILKLTDSLPFYENIIYNKEANAIRTVAYMDVDLVDTAVRNTFIVNDFIPIVNEFEEVSGLDARISGMPYIRTMNAEQLKTEMIIFVIAALLITALIFFLFFRSYRATFISMLVVLIGVIWSFGTLAILQYEITVLTALIPPLIIVIGIPNCIFLINKYQQEIKKHGIQALSLIRVIEKIGNATLMTNMTTALGFATFIILDSRLLVEFGVVASSNIIGIFILSLLIIPIIYSYMSVPNKQHLEHLNQPWIYKLIEAMKMTVKERKKWVYIITIAVLILSIVGIFQIKITGSRIEDLPKKTEFYEDIMFFEDNFNGILPLEIVVDTKSEKGVLRNANLRRINRLGDSLMTQESLSPPFSIVNLVKYLKQAYYKGLPKYYDLPSNQERNFILDALDEGTDEDIIQNYVDSTGQSARVTVYMKDVKTDEMEQIQSKLQTQIDNIFPKDRFDVYLTGKALLFLKGTKYLVQNLLLSLGLAILLIALFMAYLFRSTKMILISLVPNLLPLIITGGLMGFLGIPIKPSTILIFSIAFGISVDDTIHFLAKYRQELIASRWVIKKSVYNALTETGVSMFYTSVVLFFGFSVFIISSYGGTKALGGLVSLTLLFAMLSNLILLPSLLLTLERSIANKKVLKEPQIDILPKESKS
ncbi:MAG: transporter [Flavobacteriaceae bacterium]|nr:transporter [Flavobacteriaceae bacterium]OUX39339.1 MAG: transporter [Flavobacteriaceae bacterium TMED265]